MAQHKIGLALSGGGSKGAFQAGALRRLHEEGIKRYSAVAGVSVGALNGAMVAADKIPELHSIWEDITLEDVFRRKSILEIGWELVRWKVGLGDPPRALYDTSPLMDLIRERINPGMLRAKLEIGRVGLDDGMYHSSLKGYKLHEFHKVLLASAAIPVVCPPVKLDNQYMVDGGLVNITPLGDLIGDGCDRIIVITTEPLGYKRNVGQNHLLNIARKAIGIMTHEILVNDIKSVENVNNLVGQANGKGIELAKPGDDRPYRHIDIDVITPETPLGSGLDFSRRALTNRMRLGYQAAGHILEG